MDSVPISKYVPVKSMPMPNVMNHLPSVLSSLLSAAKGIFGALITDTLNGLHLIAMDVDSMAASMVIDPMSLNVAMVPASFKIVVLPISDRMSDGIVH